ncbi:MAG TPA: hypothetical protein PLI95_30295 [Polyangiaceae bacterium]|nr:hypothetical protein [Polyangiaceae bacterium]
MENGTPSVAHAVGPGGAHRAKARHTRGWDSHDLMNAHLFTAP